MWDKKKTEWTSTLESTDLSRVGRLTLTKSHVGEGQNFLNKIDLGVSTLEAVQLKKIFPQFLMFEFNLKMFQLKLDRNYHNCSLDNPSFIEQIFTCYIAT